MATTINHDMDQGSDFSFTVVVKDAEGNARDIDTEYQAYCQMKKFYSSSESKSLLAEVLSEGVGVIRVSLPASATTNIKPGVYFYDVELAGGDNAVPTPNTRIRVVQGMITVYPEVTK